jgi:photosystem II stability/assembly factor-like uncharacterized protein|nr:YCF48-related protein [Candidatus Krumholzibacteria bacterium]
MYGPLRITLIFLTLLMAWQAGPVVGDTFNWANPLPAGNPLNAVAFADEQRGWAVGNTGVILRTTDGGDSWSLVPDTWQTLPDLLDVVALDAETIVAVGGGSGAYRSADGGLSWTPTPAPHEGRLVNLTAVGGRLVAVGDGGAVAASFDQGLTWSAMPSPGDGYLGDQHWFDDNHGVVTAGAFPLFDGFAARTRDGGLTWEPVAAVDAGSLHNIDFMDAQTGFMIGDFEAYRSDDGGETWQDTGFAFPPYAHRMLPLPGDVWLVCAFGEGAEIHRSADRGTTWTLAFDNLSHLGVADLIQAPGGRLVAVMPSGAVITSDDDGATWQGRVSDLTNLGGHALQHVELVESGRGWAVSYYTEAAGSVAWLETEDGGRTWHARNPFPGWYAVNDLVLRDHQHGFAAGTFPGSPPFQLARTLDGGENWDFLSPPGTGSAFRLDSPAAGVVYVLTTAVEGWREVWRSDNDGDLWQPATIGLPTTALIYDLDFPTVDVGFTAGGSENPVFYRTSSGGQSWQASSASGLGGYPRQVEFQSALIGLARCQDGIYHTTDGGDTWERVLEGYGWRGLELDELGRGAVLGNSEGGLFLTEDGGATWRSLSIPWEGWDPRRSDDIPALALARSGQDLVITGGYSVLLHLEIDDVSAVPVPSVPGPLTMSAVPNPFNPATELRFELARAGYTQLELFDVRGHRVKTLLAGHLATGAHTLRWAGQDEAGRTLPSGTYLARVSSGGQHTTTKLVMVR